MLIEEEAESGVPYGRIFLGGFGPGGAVALRAALGAPARLGGLLLAHAWAPRCLPAPEAAPGLRGADALLLAGERDRAVPQWCARPRARARARRRRCRACGLYRGGPVFTSGAGGTRRMAEELREAVAARGAGGVELHFSPGQEHWLEPRDVAVMKMWLRERILSPGASAGADAAPDLDARETEIRAALRERFGEVPRPRSAPGR